MAPPTTAGTAAVDGLTILGDAEPFVCCAGACLTIGGAADMGG